MTNAQFAALRPGDVLRSPAGTLRPVLDMSRRSVLLRILRSSWTRRAYTVYTRSDLKANGWEITGLRLSVPAVKRLRGIVIVADYRTGVCPVHKWTLLQEHAL